MFSLWESSGGRAGADEDEVEAVWLEMGGEIDGLGWIIWLLMSCACWLRSDCWETVDDEGEICCFMDRSVGALVVTGAVLKNCWYC